MVTGEPGSDSIVDRVYEQLKSMAIQFEFKPGERLNEGDISKRLGVSRTPLREALNRLKTEGFLRFSPGKGFFCRELDAHDIFDLYELRKAIEVAAVRLAVKRARDEDIDDLLAFLDATGPDPGERTTMELVALDEKFHEGLMATSGNAEMLRVLRNINARIRFVRWIDMDRINRSKTQSEHRAVLLSLKERNEEACAALLQTHIDRRFDEINASIKEGYAQIYMPVAAVTRR
ncbi:DNA-binding GntR family transcriptional regulator [Pseudochelatococcus lubricantis]|uniref:DNA-binding GntR family transcriptional regulator n=1 Tax=Pseudochelatococcus lubricantis TaxID=1538102 RepID=A0ABX0UZI6_9HYPH|nr:GntR family transcriptional regulator [Pseudochelatococcus lubricantis]NIJ58342.1 DNA-binding GntR family transcriptional regulator [Pseudochelatococcus lubricantis]